MKNRFLKVCSIFLVMVLLFNMLPLQAFADGISRETPPALDVQGTPSIGQVSQEKIDVSSLKIVKEIPEKRTEFSKEFLMSNGLRMATVYNAPIHYQENGQWKEIDNTLTVKSDGTIRNTAGVWDVAFPQQLSAGKYITVTKDGYTLRFGMDGVLSGNTAVMRAGSTFSVQSAQTSTAQIEQLDTAALLADERHPETVLTKLNAQLAYSNVYSNTNIVYDLQSNKIKESVIISRYDSSLQGYRYVLDVGSLVPVLNEDNSIWFFDESKTEVVMVMPAPFMVDAEDAYNYDVQVQLTGSGSRYTLTYLLPQQWLAAEERAWPVVLDPVVTADTSASNVEDVTISQYQTFSDTATAIRCGYSTDYGITRALFKYVSLPSLTSADVIVQADIRMYETYGQESNGTPVEVHKVTEVWQSSTVNWANAPDFETAVEDFALVGQIGNYYWDVTNIVRDWYAEENTGMLFKIPTAAENNHTVRTKLFASADATANKPALNIYIRNANGLEDYWDYTASSAGRAGTGYVNNYTGNLVWVRGDMGFGGNRMPVSISHIYNLNDAINPSDSNNANDTGGNVFGLGVGWRTNFNQRVFYWQSNSDYYGWEDADGTDHYFKLQDGVYKDEDNLDLTLAIVNDANGTYRISDKYGNCSYFDAYGRLVKLSNNQEEQSHITITYDGVSYRIATIKDGVNRVYRFVYTNGLLSYIRYEGSDNQEHHRVSFTYQGDKLYKVVDADSKFCTYTYTGAVLTSVEDVDGYTLTYTHTTPSEYWQPYRVLSVSETDDNVDGGELTFAYDHNQTTITDHNGNVQVMQFNNWGNTIAVYDDEGRTQYAQYTTDIESGGKGNQLRISSKLQNTVVNLLPDNSFELGTAWSGSGATVSNSSNAAYYGSKSLKITSSGTASKTFQAAGNKTYTFSAYVKTGSSGAYLKLGNAVSETLAANSDWTRLEVSYTSTTAQTVTAQIVNVSSGTTYVDCVQVELGAAASSYNLITNGDFRDNTAWDLDQTYASIIQPTANDPSITAVIPQLSVDMLKISGIYDGTFRGWQTVTVSGGEGDTFVITGWAKGNAVPDTIPEGSENQSAVRGEFYIQVQFTYTDNTTSVSKVLFNPDVDTWQYAAAQVAAEKDYSSIKVYLGYVNGANDIYFDGIQLFKERLGSTYDYDTDGNLTTMTDVLGGTTNYTYDDVTNDLIFIEAPDATETGYIYDDYHNVVTHTTADGLVYEYTYDIYGNNTSVTISSLDELNRMIEMVSSVTYTTDGNYLVSATDAAGNVTWYGYDEQTGVLNDVQYPEDTDISVIYTYDEMFRVECVESVTDTGNYYSANYTYTNDLLTAISTGTTDYNLTYGNFGLRSSVKVGGTILASYTYTGQNNYLERLAYGNGDSVQYTYDDKGRVTQETYEDGDTVTYAYDSKGRLATVTDSATEITVTYSYDSAGRLITYVENGTDYSHRIDYTYDEWGKLEEVTERIDGVSRTTAYGYDAASRLISVTNGLSGKTYTYDDFGRVSERDVRHDGVMVFSEIISYKTANGKTSTQVEQLENGAGIFTYTYDGNGNIKTVTFEDLTTGEETTTTYTYDKLNQLTREDNQAGNFTYVWEYDDGGNILSRKKYAYTTGNLGAPTETVNYGYGNANWGDLLTSYKGSNISYDTIGNVLNDGTRTYTWEHGRELVALTKDSKTWSFTYDANGMRVRRAYANTVYQYVYNGSQLSQMTIGNNTLLFTYDAGGMPMTVTYNGTVYYYATNLQGDVVAILNNSGVAVVEYTYDAWGNVLSTTGSLKDSLGYYNPLRYRGYVYDEETGLYYLQSRYYNPAWGRFLNADAFVSTGQGLLGNNMLAYCNNNPVNGCDPCGTCVHYWFLLGLIDCDKCKTKDSVIDDFKNPDGSYSLYDNKKLNPEKIFHEQLIRFSATPSTSSLSEGKFTLGSAEVILLTGGWEWEHFDLSILDVGRAEVAAGFENNSFSLAAMASIWAPSITITIGKINISLAAHVGSVGGEINVGADGFKIGAASGWGGSVAVTWG